MCRRWPLLLALLCPVAGCTKEQDYIDVVNDNHAALKELTEILKSVKDEKSMKEAKQTLEESGEKYAAIARRASALPKPPPKKVQERIREDIPLINQTVERLKAETERIGRIPGGPEFLKRFESTKGLLSAVQP